LKKIASCKLQIANGDFSLLASPIKSKQIELVFWLWDSKKKMALPFQ